MSIQRLKFGGRPSAPFWARQSCRTGSHTRSVQYSLRMGLDPVRVDQGNSMDLCIHIDIYIYIYVHISLTTLCFITKEFAGIPFEHIYLFVSSVSRLHRFSMDSSCCFSISSSSAWGPKRSSQIAVENAGEVTGQISQEKHHILNVRIYVACVWGTMTAYIGIFDLVASNLKQLVWTNISNSETVDKANIWIPRIYVHTCAPTHTHTHL